MLNDFLNCRFEIVLKGKLIREEHYEGEKIEPNTFFGIPFVLSNYSASIDVNWSQNKMKDFISKVKLSHLYFKWKNINWHWVEYKNVWFQV